jgi:bacterioferritin-associated ferredoxin
MIVCHCEVLTHRDIAASIALGAGTLGTVCRSTGAGQACGGCVFAIKRLLCEHGPTSVPPSPEVDLAAS